MPWSSDKTVQELRLKYHAALSAHQSSANVLAEASKTDNPPAAPAVEAESRARDELARARDALYSAMAAFAPDADKDPS